MRDFYIEQTNRKRDWEPSFGTKGEIVPGAEKTLGKALSLSILELDVKAWLQEGCRRDLNQLSDSMKIAIESNMEDEDKHDEILSYIRDLYGLTTSEMTSEAENIRQEWKSLPDHPIAITAAIETSVFFVILPIYRFLSGKGGCLTTASADISNDENSHAATHRQICKDLGIKMSDRVNQLRKETIDWMVSDLRAPMAGKYGKKVTWQKSSDSLFERGVAPDLASTAAAVMPAFFERNNADLPSYG